MVKGAILKYSSVLFGYRPSGKIQLWLVSIMYVSATPSVLVFPVIKRKSLNAQTHQIINEILLPDLFQVMFESEILQARIFNILLILYKPLRFLRTQRL